MMYYSLAEICTAHIQFRVNPSSFFTTVARFSKFSELRGPAPTCSSQLVSNILLSSTERGLSTLFERIAYWETHVVFHSIDEAS